MLVNSQEAADPGLREGVVLERKLVEGVTVTEGKVIGRPDGCSDRQILNRNVGPRVQDSEGFVISTGVNAERVRSGSVPFRDVETINDLILNVARVPGPVEATDDSARTIRHRVRHRVRPDMRLLGVGTEIGRASCRERGEGWVGGVGRETRGT